ncbi:MAG: acetylxylan esterase [Kiritimatiellae bacterium]|nr:acetylxylan esterase [Kiritimatiellia bacterium]
MIKHHVLTILALVAALSALSGPLDDAYLIGRTSRPALSYKVGEKITFYLTLEHAGVLESNKYFISWKREGDDKKTFSGRVPLPIEHPVAVETSLDKPGFVRLSAQVVDASGRVYEKNIPENALTPDGSRPLNIYERREKALCFDGSAAAEPEKLDTLPEPSDFDAFWERQRARLSKVAMRINRKEVSSARPGFRTWAVEVDAPGLRPVTGYLAVPEGASPINRFPAVLTAHGYGGEVFVHRNMWGRNPRDGYITFDINAHGMRLPAFGADEAYQKALRWEVGSNGKTYGLDPAQNADPETAYFNGMCLRIMRALEFLKTLPEWNGKDLEAWGISQGGLQAIWAGALDKDVTKVTAGVPWCCDMAGGAAGRLRLGWGVPWVPALGYYDPVNMAARIPPTCTVEVSRAGLGDNLCCPPSGIAIFYNRLTCPKSIRWVQGGTHGYSPPVPYAEVFTFSNGVARVKSDSCPSLDISVPFSFGLCANFDGGIKALRRLRTEFGVKRVLLTGCPGVRTRIVGWEPGLSQFEEFGDQMARIREAVADIDLEVGWYLGPVLACAKNGPFQFMVGDTGREALHAPCPLDADFLAALCRRIRTVCERGRPSTIMFEDDLHFGWQRDKTNDGWTGLCCYCPLHLAKVAEKCGRHYTREQLIDIMKERTPEAERARRAFDSAKIDSLIAFGKAIRKVVDGVSPEIRMGLCGNSDMSHGRSDASEFARAVAGRYRPLVRIPCSTYDSNGSFEEMLNCVSRGYRSFLKCPRDIERMQELDAYPHNHFFMPDAILSALLAKAVSCGSESVLFYGLHGNDKPIEDDDGYFRCLLRENRRMAVLRDELKGMSPCGVFAPEADPTINFFGARYGFPMSLDRGSTTLLAGSAAETMDSAELEKLLRCGGVVLDGRCAAAATKLGLASVMGAEVSAAAEFPIVHEWSEDVAVSRRVPGRHIMNANFAAPTPAEKSSCAAMKAVGGAKQETLVGFVDSDGNQYAPSVMRVTTADGRRFGFISTTITGNRSVALFSVRKREVIADLLEWASGGEIPVRVADERNVEVIANESPDGKTMVLTVLVLRADCIDGIDLMFSGEWLNADAEELGYDGKWRTFAVGRTEWRRNRRFGGEFRPGIARIFRLRRK